MIAQLLRYVVALHSHISCIKKKDNDHLHAQKGKTVCLSGFLKTYAESQASLRAILCIGQIIQVHVCNWNIKHDIFNTENKLPLFVY